MSETESPGAAVGGARGAATTGLAGAATTARGRALTVGEYRALGRTLGRVLRGAPVTRSPLVCVLDLNGVLLERLQIGAKSHREAVRAARAARPADLRVQGRDIWLRPHRDALLRYLHARHRLAVWSSASERTISALVTKSVLLAGTSILRRALAFVRDRSSCRRDPLAGTNGIKNFATIKPLDVIWRDPECRTICDPRNTVIIDDTPSKTRINPDNAICISEYTARNEEIDFNTDETLLWAAMYIEHLASFPVPLADRNNRGIHASGPDPPTNIAEDIRLRIIGSVSLADFIEHGRKMAKEDTSSASVGAFIDPGVLSCPLVRHAPDGVVPRWRAALLNGKTHGECASPSGQNEPADEPEECGVGDPQVRLEIAIDDAEGVGLHNRMQEVSDKRSVNRSEVADVDAATGSTTGCQATASYAKRSRTPPGKLPKTGGDQDTDAGDGKQTGTRSGQAGSARNDAQAGTGEYKALGTGGSQGPDTRYSVRTGNIETESSDANGGLGSGSTRGGKRCMRDGLQPGAAQDDPAHSEARSRKRVSDGDRSPRKRRMLTPAASFVPRTTDAK